MKQVHLHGKSFNESDFNKLIIGGQTGADTIRFVVPKVYGGELDLSSWTWSITYENKEGTGDTVILQAVPSSVESDLLYIDWVPSRTATQVSGKLECQVFAVMNSDNSQKRFACAPFSVYVEPWLNPDPIVQTLPTVIEQALELMEHYTANVDEALKSGAEAKKYAENASLHEGNAQKHASDALTYRNQAEEFKNATETDANNVANIEIAINEAKISVENKAKEAGDSASAASVSEKNAKDYRDATAQSVTDINQMKQSIEQISSSLSQFVREQNADITQKAQSTAQNSEAANNAKIAAETAKADADKAKLAAQEAEKKALEYKNAINPSQFVAKTSVTQGQYTIPGGFNGSLS